MNINIVERTKYTSSQLKLIDEISAEFRVDKEIAKLLVSRDINSISEAEKFLFVSKDNLYDPFLLSGMKEFVERLLSAIENQETIVVYGDYDADGICGGYILTQAILDLGGIAIPYIPNRSEGYGLNIQAIEEIAEEYFPDLIITCDLGISCFEEVEYIKNLGIDVMVSDHHELPSVLPECVRINPKLDEGKYPCIDLCGAGVALKIVQALMPNDFMKFIEFACIATVADSVTLKDENRAIVKLGLEKINQNPSQTLKILMDECGVKGEVTSTTIAFIIAPRINASGRMGEALRSLKLLMEEDRTSIKELVTDINNDNVLRQKYCEEIFLDGFNKFIQQPNKHAIILASNKWQSGLLGIVASKLSEEFSRPTILFVEGEDALRGSGRSIEGINLFEMLSTMDDLFVTFGGHAQACGLTIKKENFAEFSQRVENYLKENVSLEAFVPTAKYDINEEEVNPTIELVKALNILEPYGVGNTKPIFLRKEGSILVSPMKNYPQHLVGEGEFSELLAFSQSKYIDVFRNELEKALFIDYSINAFRGKETVKGNIKDFFSIYNKGRINDKRLTLDYLFNANFKKLSLINENQFKKLIKENGFGILAVASTASGLEKLNELTKDCTCLFEANALVVKSNINRVLLSPKSSINFVKFNNIIFCENYSSVELSGQNKGTNIYSLNDERYLENIDVKQDRDLFAKMYVELKKLNDTAVVSFENITQVLAKIGIDEITAMVGYAVFKELELFSIENDKIIFAKNKKVELTDSELFKKLKV